MGFSAIKTRWIGFGDDDWDAMMLRDTLLPPVKDLRILGYRFNRHLNWSAHVRYSLGRSLQARHRISALTRRFSGNQSNPFKAFFSFFFSSFHGYAHCFSKVDLSPILFSQGTGWKYGTGNPHIQSSIEYEWSGTLSK
ncbi:hypothetical protein L873DRAFT_1799270 [Choiromyces venosus 120613-1]|uniref:Uncharacterized protein n=1 Tax=Choiromyces venosus 120613-1 TaxID=1336337 RepID=A0A3N4K1H1_9PEZI|nr:hypothetical protein L873DRAFT_1799270 [Choiromyces venosus 120613-1]